MLIVASRGVPRAGKGGEAGGCPAPPQPPWGRPAETRPADGSPRSAAGWGLNLASSPLQQPEPPQPPACRAHGSHEGHSRPLRSPHRKPQGRDSLSPFSLNPHIQRRTPSISPVFTRPSVQHLQGRMMLGSTRCWLHP